MGQLVSFVHGRAVLRPGQPAADVLQGKLQHRYAEGLSRLAERGRLQGDAFHRLIHMHRDIHGEPAVHPGRQRHVAGGLRGDGHAVHRQIGRFERELAAIVRRNRRERKAPPLQRERFAHVQRNRPRIAEGTGALPAVAAGSVAVKQRPCLRPAALAAVDHRRLTNKRHAVKHLRAVGQVQPLRIRQSQEAQILHALRHGDVFRLQGKLTDAVHRGGQAHARHRRAHVPARDLRRDHHSVRRAGVAPNADSRALVAQLVFFPACHAIAEIRPAQRRRRRRLRGADEPLHARECFSADAFDTVRQRDARLLAIVECAGADARHALRDRQARQRAAALERASANAPQTLRSCTSVRLSQPLNALSPMLITPSGMDTLVALRPTNALSPMPFTPSPQHDRQNLRARQTTASPSR